LGFTDISVSAISASIGVDKRLLYSSRIQTTCARQHNEASQDSYPTAMLAGAVSQAHRQDQPWSVRQPLQPKQKHHREVLQYFQPPRAGVVYE